MSFIVHILGGPHTNEQGHYYNDCLIMENDGTYHEEEVYYDSEEEALDDLDMVEYGPIDLDYEWYDGDDE